jgi:predicted transcriptional regulator
LSSKKKKIKIELEDDEGGKYNLSLEGNFSKEKILQVIELMELVRSDSTNCSGSAITTNSSQDNNRTLSVDSKIWNIIEQSFSYNPFTSSDIVHIYNKKYNETIKLSIISTYLARYVTKGKLKRTKRLREYVYNLVSTSSTNPESVNTELASSNSDNDNKFIYDVRRKTIDDLKN